MCKIFDCSNGGSMPIYIYISRYELAAINGIITYTGEGEDATARLHRSKTSEHSFQQKLGKQYLLAPQSSQFFLIFISLCSSQAFFNKIN